MWMVSAVGGMGEGDWIWCENGRGSRWCRRGRGIEDCLGMWRGEVGVVQE